jgi:ribosomal protein S18 acetylase RimI-like enzyme
MRIARWTPADLRSRLSEAMALYAEAMQYPPEAGQHRAGFAVAHTRRAGFRSVAAVQERGDCPPVGGGFPPGAQPGPPPGAGPAPGSWADGTLIGFGYGYATAPGQWWHDQVRTALSPGQAAAWLTGCFELSELHVRPAWQGRGIGRALLTTLVDGLPQRTVLLSTPEGDTRAWRLYRSLGFVGLVRHHLFPGDSRPFAVLGATLPLTAAGADPAQPDRPLRAEGPRP